MRCYINCRVINLVFLEEVDQVTLVRLEGYLRSKLMDSQLLDDLEDIKFFGQFTLSHTEQEIGSFLFRPTAAGADSLVKDLEAQESAIPVGEGLARVDFPLDTILAIVVLR